MSIVDFTGELEDKVDLLVINGINIYFSLKFMIFLSFSYYKLLFSSFLVDN